MEKFEKREIDDEESAEAISGLKIERQIQMKTFR